MTIPVSETGSTSSPIPASVAESRPFVVHTYGTTDRGRERPNNEDHFLIAELARTLTVHGTSLPLPKVQQNSHRGHVFVVADGMGGHKAGERASALSVVTVESFLLNSLKRFLSLETAEEHNVLKEFRNALREADSRIFEESNQHPKLWGMGTTFTMAFAVDWKLYVAHVGDSRCYLFSDGTLQQLTNDHTVTGEFIRKGVMTPEQAAKSPYRNVVTNVLGGQKPGVQVEVHQLELAPGDTLLVCSDGLSNMLSPERISHILRDNRIAQKACETMVNEANECGGPDNITALVARFETA